MKTIKNIFYALAAVAMVGFVGCTKDQGYTPGEDIQGEQIYIDNSTTAFNVQTAEEKEAEAAELKKLSRGLQTEPEAFEDDKEIALKVVRKGGKTAEYTTSVEIAVADVKSLALFTFPAEAVVKENTPNTMVVPVTFAEGETEVNIVLGFNIDALGTNVEHKMTATIIDENLSNYGASTLDFVVCHKVPVELPFTKCGTITLTEDWYGPFSGSGIVIEINDHDYKAWKEDKKAMPYIRYRIPKYMYQIVAADIEAGAGNFEEGDLKYFEDCDDVMFHMTTKFELVCDYDNKAYAAPLAEDITKGGTNNLFGFVGIDKNGNPSTILYDTNLVFNSTLRGGWYYHSANCSLERSGYTYNIVGMLCDIDAGSLYGGYLTLSFVWDTNDLQANWSDYFKVDYVKDIDYAKVAGAGTYTSTAFPAADGTAQSWAQDIYVGMDSGKGKQVYFLPNIYSTSTAEQTFGLAMHVEGESLTVIEGQPTGLTVMGKALFASQSSEIASAAEYTADGALKKLTIGLALSFEDGTVLGEYEEVYEFNAAAVGVDAFCGDFSLFTTEIYSPYYGADGKQTAPKLSAFTANVTIVKDGDAGKVKIYGLDAGYLAEMGAGAAGYVVGEYDAVQNAIVVPAQFFQGAGFVAGAYLGYFQPGNATYGAYNTQSGPMYMSELAETAGSCALVYGQGGVLTMTTSLSDATGVFVDSYSLDLYELGSSYEWEYYTNLVTTFGNGGAYAPTLTPVAAAGTQSTKADVEAAQPIEGRQVVARAAKAARTAKVKKAISLNKVINVEALVK